MESQKNEQTTLDGLPDEILLEIFKEMDGQTLKNSALVCKNWNNLIGHSTDTMKKLPFKFEHSKWPNNLSELDQFTKDLSRQYHTIHIKTNFEWSNERVKILENIGKNARCLLMKGIVAVNYGSPILSDIMAITQSTNNKLTAVCLTKILECLPKLETIVFSNCFVNYEALDMAAVTLTQLKSVVLHRTT